MKTLIACLILGTASPAMAQHAEHKMPMSQPSATMASDTDAEPAEPVEEGHTSNHGTTDRSPQEDGQEAASAMDHSMMDHGAMDAAQMNHSQMDHSTMTHAQPAESMDHSQMDHSAMPQQPVDHAAMGHGEMAMPIPNAPPPVSAGSGPARAAETIWGVEEMRSSREALIHETGSQKTFWFQGDRVEYRTRQGSDGYLWDIQGYYGGDIDKFWFKSEGEGSFGEQIESAEIQALWSRAIAPFFDFQAGVRQDLAGPNRTHAVIGVQGLMPYLFEVDAAAFLSNKGDLTARIEGELDQRITQRLIVQPRAEIALSAQDIPELGIGAGIDKIEAGVRLRYEFSREFAPYVGIDQEWKIGNSADFARAAGEDASVTNYVIGIRFWF